MKEQRIKNIMELVNQEGSVSIADLAERFETSEMTIHRDLNLLESRGLLTKKRGVAVVNPYRDTFADRSISCLKEKQHIAKKAYELVEDCDTIFLDGSTTAIEISKLLKKDKKITVFTNSIRILNELVDAVDVTLYSLGSYYAREIVHFVGADVEEKISQLCFSKSFIGVAGISEDLDLMDPHPLLASVKRKVIHSSAISYIVADHTKFGAYAVQKFEHLDNINYVITDEEVPEPFNSILKEKLVF